MGYLFTNAQNENDRRYKAFLSELKNHLIALNELLCKWPECPPSLQADWGMF